MRFQVAGAWVGLVSLPLRRMAMRLIRHAKKKRQSGEAEYDGEKAEDSIST
jgi:hypothetical protein